MSEESSLWITNRIHHFNGAHGWKLRSLVRQHHVVRAKIQYCALRGMNKGPFVLRAKPASSCNLCHVNLCTIPREKEQGLFCFQYWHCSDVLIERAYYSKPSVEQRYSNENPTNTSQKESRPSTPPSRTQHTTANRSGGAPQSPPQFHNSRKSSLPIGVERFRAQCQEEERRREEKDSVQEAAERVVEEWKHRNRSLRKMLRGLSDVIPYDIKCAEFGELDNDEKVKRAYKLVRASLRPDRVRRYNLSVLEGEITSTTFVAIGDEYGIKFGE